MSSNKTPNLNLHSWIPSDKVLRSEFVNNFEKIDAKFNASNGHSHDGTAGSGGRIETSSIDYNNENAKDVLDKLFQSANNNLKYTATIIGEEFNPLGSTADNNLNKYHAINNTYKNDIVDVINFKGGEADESFTMADLSKAIDDIPYHIDPQGTATQWDVAQGYSFYNKDSLGTHPHETRKAGAVPTISDRVFVPRATLQQLERDVIYSDCVVKGSPNLLPENIVKGKSLYGINGTLTPQEGYYPGDILGPTQYGRRLQDFETDVRHDAINMTVKVFNQSTSIATGSMGMVHITKNGVKKGYHVPEEQHMIDALFGEGTLLKDYIITKDTIITIDSSKTPYEITKVSFAGYLRGQEGNKPKETVVGSFLDKGKIGIVTSRGRFIKRSDDNTLDCHEIPFYNVSYFKYDRHLNLLYVLDDGVDSKRRASYIIKTDDYKSKSALSDTGGGAVKDMLYMNDLLYLAVVKNNRKTVELYKCNPLLLSGHETSTVKISDYDFPDTSGFAVEQCTIVNPDKVLAFIHSSYHELVMNTRTRTILELDWSRRNSDMMTYVCRDFDNNYTVYGCNGVDSYTSSTEETVMLELFYYGE